MRVLVTGSCGLVGANMVRLLVERGHTVRAMVFEDVRALDGLEVERVVADVRRPETLAPAVAGMDAVIHLAAVIAIEREPLPALEAVNVVGTRNVAAACLAADVKRLVHVSSVHALSRHPADEPFHEERALALGPEHHPYDRSKAAGELEVLGSVQAGLNAVILTPVGVFGPHDHGPSPTGKLLTQLGRRQIPALVDAGFWWVDARDVAGACEAALTRGRRGARYLLHSEYATARQIGDWCAEATGVPAPRITAPMWLATATAPFARALAGIARRRPLYTSSSLDILRHHQRIESTRARDELGFAPRPVRQSVFDAVAWLRAEGVLP